MNKEDFFSKKEHVVQLIQARLQLAQLDNVEKESLNKLLRLLERYTYDSRLEIKGLLAHTIVDSLTVDYSIGEKVIDFDNGIR